MMASLESLASEMGLGTYTTLDDYSKYNNVFSCLSKTITANHRRLRRCFLSLPNARRIGDARL
jgi:hypothetical protein